MHSERRNGSRFMVSLPIRIQWNDESGQRIVEEGVTENVGPDGTLVHLPRRLPRVGSRVEIAVFEIDNQAEVMQTEAEVLRIERNIAHPQAALRVVEAVEKWRVNVYENENIKLAAIGTPETYEE